MNTNNIVISTKCTKCGKEYKIYGEEELKERAVYDYKCDECIALEYKKFFGTCYSMYNIS